MSTETTTPVATESTVDTVKKTADVANTLQGALKAIQAIATSDTLTNIIRLIAMLFIGVGWFLLRKRLTKILIEKAKELSEHEKEELRRYLAGVQERSDDSVVTDLEQGF